MFRVHDFNVDVYCLLLRIDDLVSRVWFARVRVEGLRFDIYY